MKNFGLRISELLTLHLRIFTAWGLLNAGAGLFLLLFSSGFLRYFMLMNTVWGWVNLGFAVLFYVHIRLRRFLTEGLPAQLKVRKHVCEMLLINVLLDIGYCSAGAFLLVKSQNVPEYGTMLEAFGWAVVLQGGFLLLQDMWFYSWHRRNTAGLEP